MVAPPLVLFWCVSSRHCQLPHCGGWKMRLIGVQLVEPFPRQAKLITGFVESRDQFHTTTNQRGHEQTGGGKREAPVGYLQLDSRT